MKLGFSEFSYGYAFTENLIRSSASEPTEAPFFPNLVQEGQLGYDVNINLPGVQLFFQFKLPELMKRRTAREIYPLGLDKHGLDIPFFRMPLMRKDHSDQHALLIGYEEHFPNSVFYASPGNQDDDSFNDAYRQAEVHLQSVLFSPADIGELPDNEAHSVSYCPVKRIAWFCSKPREVKVHTFDEIAEATNKLLAERRDRGHSLEETTAEIGESVRSFIPAKLRNAERELHERIKSRLQTAPIDDRARSVLTELLALRELVRVGVGVELLIAQPRQ